MFTSHVREARSLQESDNVLNHARLQDRTYPPPWSEHRGCLRARGFFFGGGTATSLHHKFSRYEKMVRKHRGVSKSQGVEGPQFFFGFWRFLDRGGGDKNGFILTSD